jgi:FdhD protein
MTRPQAPTVATRRWRAGRWREADDELAAEEPLQLLLDGAPLSVVMRTPGADVELALGMLWAERVVTDRDQLRGVRVSAEADEEGVDPLVRGDLVEPNQIDVLLAPGSGDRRPRRSFLASSACGVCGATTVESLALDFPPLGPGPTISPALLSHLTERLRDDQRLFDRTGGLHAAAVFDAGGRLITLREDVGRHNAVDKVVGRALLEGRLPLSDHVLVVSGRGGYEIVQKAVAAGIPVVAAVGAPSSLAVAVARRFRLTLAGFVRGGRLNVYSGAERVADEVRT